MNIVNKEHYGGQSVQMQSYALNVGKHMIYETRGTLPGAPFFYSVDSIKAAE